MFALALAAGVVANAAAQDQAQDTRPVVVVQAPQGPPPFANVRGYSNDYQIGPGDLLDIQVIGQESLRQALRVTNAGEISYPMLGVFHVADMTAFEVENEIARRLREKGLMEQPEALVFVQEYQSKPVYVSGSVVNPGQFVMSQDLTVVDAILLAGGLKFNAADEGLIHRRTSKDARNVSAASIAAAPGVARPGIEIIKVDLVPMKEGRFPESAMPLRSGDVLVVPEQYVHPFYVVGEVTDPRNFAYLPGKTPTASQAISWAGGPTLTAKMSDGILVRFDQAGNRTETKVDYAAILEGRQTDFMIQQDDIIFIPGSKAKTIGYGMLMLTDTMLMSASFRIARTYQMPDAPDRPPQ